MITPYLEEKILKGEAIYRRATIGFSPLMAILCQPLKTLIITEIEILPMTPNFYTTPNPPPDWIPVFNKETVFQINIYNGKTNNFIFYKPNAYYEPYTNDLMEIRNFLGFSLPARKYDTYIVSNNDVIINVCMIPEVDINFVGAVPKNTSVAENLPDAQQNLGNVPISTSAGKIVNAVEANNLDYIPITKKYQLNINPNSNTCDEFIIGRPQLSPSKLNFFNTPTLSFEAMNQLAQFNIEFVILNQNKA
jgi:hypothetical protein